MNRYPAWLNFLVLGLLLLGAVLALPNVYGSVPAVQLVTDSGQPYGDSRTAEITELLVGEGVTPAAAYLEDGRVVLRFGSATDQERARDLLRERYREASVSATLTPALPAWLRELGLEPMSLGLDLRGGMHILLEVDVDTAIASRLNGYEQDLDDRLRGANIRHRVELKGRTLTVRVTSAEDAARARNIVNRVDPDLVIFDGPD
ncbi:MAG TPA: protein translocase subunit SecD, partial [Woeseiaceae bacterium]|nr:protein translocase subunit SecD [Woeseiaceae bacterium]